MNKSSASLRLIPAFVALLLTTLTFSAQAVTTLVGDSKYSVTEGVAFTLGSYGADNFLFNWTDPTGEYPSNFSLIADPTLVLTLGQTYTFQRTSGSHPFAIMNNTAAAFMSGTDGSYSRTTFTPTTISNATIFTANPGTPGTAVSWTPSQIGDFWYTCSVTGHPGMAGKITVAVPEPSSFSLLLLGLGALSIRRRRH